MTEQTKFQWMIVLHVALMFFGIGLFRTTRAFGDVSDGAAGDGGSDCGGDGGSC